jgi:hypothetical protein
MIIFCRNSPGRSNHVQSAPSKSFVSFSWTLSNRIQKCRLMLIMSDWHCTCRNNPFDSPVCEASEFILPWRSLAFIRHPFLRRWRKQSSSLAIAVAVYQRSRMVIPTAIGCIRGDGCEREAMTEITNGNFALLTEILCIRVANFVVTGNGRSFYVSQT